jgi:hypothetical protein
MNTKEGSYSESKLDVKDVKDLVKNEFALTDFFIFLSPEESKLYVIKKEKLFAYDGKEVPFYEKGKLRTVGKLIRADDFKYYTYDTSLNTFSENYNEAKNGEKGVELVKTVLEAKGYSCKIIEDVEKQTSGVDLEVNKDGKQLSIEVKTDFRCIKTGNLYFETYRPKRKAERNLC